MGNSFGAVKKKSKVKTKNKVETTSRRNILCENQEPRELAFSAEHDLWFLFLYYILSIARYYGLFRCCLFK